MVAGAVRLWRDEPVRSLLYAAAFVELGFFAVNGKSYYPGPIYALLYAAGAVTAEQVLRSAWSRRGAVAAAVLATAVVLPLGLPLLPAATVGSSGLWKARKDYADMFGWPALAAQVAAAYESLPPADRSRTAILAENFGEAGAVDLYGPRLGLPRASSGHLSYWLWGPAQPDPTTVIAVGYARPYLEQRFGVVREAGVIDMPYGIHNEEYGRAIYVCTQPRESLAAMWPDLKAFS